MCFSAGATISREGPASWYAPPLLDKGATNGGCKGKLTREYVVCRGCGCKLCVYSAPWRRMPSPQGTPSKLEASQICEYRTVFPMYMGYLF
jgi:hypothetical protein